MEQYFNIGGFGGTSVLAGGTSTSSVASTASSGSKLFSQEDLGGLIGTALGMVIGNMMAKKTQKQNEELIAQLQQLDDAQTKELNDKVTAQTNELDKEKVVYDYITKQQGLGLIKNIKSKRVLPLIGVGVLTVVMVFIFVALKKKKNG